jgi:hypothetical protein
MKASRFTKITGCLMLSGLLFLSACAAGSGRPTSDPFPRYQEEEQDPFFWQMWQDQRGISG